MRADLFSLFLKFIHGRLIGVDQTSVAYGPYRTANRQQVPPAVICVRYMEKSIDQLSTSVGVHSG